MHLISSFSTASLIGAHTIFNHIADRFTEAHSNAVYLHTVEFRISIARFDCKQKKNLEIIS